MNFVSLDPRPEIKEEDEGDDENFQAADKFDGHRPGFSFTTGRRGTGYYRDNPIDTKKAKREKPDDVKDEPKDEPSSPSSKKRRKQ